MSNARSKHCRSDTIMVPSFSSSRLCTSGFPLSGGACRPGTWSRRTLVTPCTRRAVMNRDLGSTAMPANTLRTVRACDCLHHRSCSQVHLTRGEPYESRSCANAAAASLLKQSSIMTPGFSTGPTAQPVSSGRPHCTSLHIQVFCVSCRTCLCITTHSARLVA